MGTIRHKLPEWSEQSIQKVLNEKYMPRAKYVINNLFVFQGESDYLAMTLSGYWYECEIKISLADFKNDFAHKAEKHLILARGFDSHGKIKPRPHFFSYAVPEPLVEKVVPLLPQYAGLIAITANGFLIMKKAPVLLHRRKYTIEELRLTDKFYYGWVSYKDKYNNFSKELAKYRAELNSIKAEFKAVTGQTYKSYLKDAL